MTRHVLDFPKPRRSASKLRRFLMLDRQNGAPVLHRALARLPRERNAARRFAAFGRVARAQAL
ncbi:hypothetical protein [Oceaniglobus trochenteri]|uniref:hypothetical protein n=1 Tax=Oceaniglobus trochenteri TaxID=2763260 RepID=UPI001CFF8788|nr:hypothetical protein [Oceaniglobus trochenteri]